MRDHGGDIDQAIARFGGARADWLDLSTGINPRPYPVSAIPQSAWEALPTPSETSALAAAAKAAYRAGAEVIPVPGAQAAIQAIPWLRAPGAARVLEPTYNEHRAALVVAGWQVARAETLEALRGADLAVLVNPNNPDGRKHQPEELLALAGDVGLLVVDESFADADPALSLAPHLTNDCNILVLRSFGKFYGLAGVRLGFVIAGAESGARVRDLIGPWAVSGPAITIGAKALSDGNWRAATTARLEQDAARLDALATSAGWRIAGGTSLFRLYETPDAEMARDRLAGGRVWSRIFPYSHNWVRLGLPDGAAAWRQIGAALASV